MSDDSYFHCIRMSAIIPNYTCLMFRSMAERAIRLLLSGMKLHSVYHLDIDRFMRCSRCLNLCWDYNAFPQSTLNSVYSLIRSEISAGFDRIEEFDWFRHDPEVVSSRGRARSAKWRSAHREQERERLRRYRASLKAKTK